VPYANREIHAVFRETASATSSYPLRRSRCTEPSFDSALRGKVTGLSLAACSRIRAGAKVPHPRHWAAMHGLIRDELLK
jgi:hypothetical protein